MSNFFSHTFFEKNRQKLKGHMDNDSLAILFSSHKMPKKGDQFYPFKQNSDLFYLSGIEQEETILVIEKDRDFLFISRPGKQSAIWEGERLNADEAGQISGIDNIRWSHDFETTIEKRLREKKKVYFNTVEKLDINGIRSKDEMYLEQFRLKYPFHSIFTLRTILTELRLRKEPEEIEAIQKAIDISAQAFKKMLPVIEPGLSEKAVEAELTRELILNHSEFAFDPIIASGKNANILHYTKNNDIYRDNELILIDFGAEHKNYAADITRTIPVNGKFSSRQKECYQALLDVMKRVQNDIKPGLTIRELNQKVVDQLAEKHIELGLYKKEDLENKQPPPWKKYFPHGVSHFIGLDVHDCGDKNVILDKGMVISWEPGIYIPEENLGIRIEDDILVDTPAVNLSAHIPKEVKEIEKMTGQ